MEKWKNRDDGKRWMRNATRSDLSQVGVYGKSDKPEELKQLFVQVHDYGGGTTTRHVLEAAPQYNFFRVVINSHLHNYIASINSIPSYQYVNNKITNESAKEVVASVVPMNIQYSGPANTEDYFAPSKTQETQPDGTLLDVAYFRGCKLVGKTLELDKYDVKGYVINKSEHLVSDKETGEVKTAVTYIPVGNFQN